MGFIKKKYFVYEKIDFIKIKPTSIIATIAVESLLSLTNFFNTFSTLTVPLHSHWFAPFIDCIAAALS